MIFTKQIYDKFLLYKNNNLFISGNNLSYLHECIAIESFKNKIEDNISFKNNNYIYVLDTSTKSKKKDIFLFITKLVSSKNFFITESIKKVIILLSIDKLSEKDFMKLNYIIQNSYQSSVFLIHSIYNHGIISLFNNLYQSFTLPYKIESNIIDTKSYNIILKLLKSKFTKKSLLKIRELTYYYYMNHKSSIPLIHLILQGIGDNIYLPNPIKCDIVQDLTKLNAMYFHCYRKPIFFECMILSLFKHLEHYTYNL